MAEAASRSVHLGSTRGGVALVLIAVVAHALCGCSTLLRSDSADFKEVRDARDGEAQDACGFLGPPTYLKAPTPASGALFGGTLAASGDTLVTSAWFENGAEDKAVNTDRPGASEGAGAIRLYERATAPNGTPSMEVRHASGSPPILPTDRLPGLLRGLALLTTHPVAVNDSWLAIGDAGSDGFRGAVRVFQRGGDGLTPVHVVSPDDPEENALFGLAVALSGDTLVVGAPGSDRGAEDAGMAYVYDLGNSEAVLAGTIVPREPRAAGWFGAAIALSPDWLVLTAPGDEGAGAAGDDGGAYAYRRAGSAVDRTPRLVPRPHGTHYFGASVAIQDDWLAIGAPGTPGAAPFAGAALLFRRVSEDWILAGTLDADGHDGLLFGWTVALTESALFVGYPWAAPGPAVDVGGVHAFPRDDSSGIRGPLCRLTAPNADAGDAFGTALVASDRFVAVSAPYEDGSAGGVSEPDLANDLPDTGAVYVYRTQSDP